MFQVTSRIPLLVNGSTVLTVSDAYLKILLGPIISTFVSRYTQTFQSNDKRFTISCKIVTHRPSSTSLFAPRADYARRLPALGDGKAVGTPMRKSDEKISAAATTSDGLSAELVPSAGGDGMISSQRRKHGVHDFHPFIFVHLTSDALSRSRIHPACVPHQTVCSLNSLRVSAF